MKMVFFVHCTDCGMHFTILNYSVLIYSSFVHAIVCYYILVCQKKRFVTTFLNDCHPNFKIHKKITLIIYLVLNFFHIL